MHQSLEILSPEVPWSSRRGGASFRTENILSPLASPSTSNVDKKSQENKKALGRKTTQGKKVTDELKYFILLFEMDFTILVFYIITNTIIINIYIYIV